MRFPTATMFAAVSCSSDVSRTTDAISIAKMQLRQLQADIRAALPAYKDVISRAHLMDVSERIIEVLDPK